MKLVKCNKGHRFDATFSKYCPECAMNGLLNAYEEEPETQQETQYPETAPASDIVRCPNGHFYDPTITPSCPECARLEQEEFPETVPVMPLQETELPILKCSRGHFYDRSLGKCPVCAAMDSPTEEKPHTVVLQTCSRGHRYNPAVSDMCPECAILDSMNRSSYPREDTEKRELPPDSPFLLDVEIPETPTELTEDETDYPETVPLDDFPEDVTQPVPVEIPTEWTEDETDYPETVPLDDFPEDVTQPVPVEIPTEWTEDETDYPETVPLDDFPEDVTQPVPVEIPTEWTEEETDYPETVPVPQVEELIAQCPKGHFYNRSFDRCPVCEAMSYDMIEEPEPVEQFVEMCSKGHRYQRSVADYCPVCAAMEGRCDPEVALKPVEQPVPAFRKVITAQPEPVEAQESFEIPRFVEEPETIELPELVTQTETDAVPELVEAPETVEISEPVAEPETIALPAEKEAAAEPQTEVQEAAAPVSMLINDHPFIRLHDTISMEDYEILTEFANLPNPSNTLIFTTYGGISFRMYVNQGKLMLQLRERLRYPVITLEKTICVPNEEARAVAREITEILTENRYALEKLEQNPAGNCRILFVSKALSCDCRWTETDLGRSIQAEYNVMQQIHLVLYRLLAQFDPTPKNVMEVSSGLVAKLEYEALTLVLSRFHTMYRLKLQRRICYEQTESVTLEEEIYLSEQSGREQEDYLGQCRVMETLLQKRQNAADAEQQESGELTGFYLHSGELLFSYRDRYAYWYGDTSPLKNARHYLLSSFVATAGE